MDAPNSGKRVIDQNDVIVLDESARKRSQRQEDGPLSPSFSLSSSQSHRSRALPPVPSVSNSLQKSLAGRTVEDVARNSVKYDTSYRYKPPNYVVTDVPDLWSNSKIEVTEDESPQSPVATEQSSENTSPKLENTVKVELNEDSDEPLTFEEWKAKRSSTNSSRLAEDTSETTQQTATSISFNASDMQDLDTVKPRKKLGDRLSTLAVKDDSESAKADIVSIPLPDKKITLALHCFISDDLSLDELHSVAKKKKTGGLFGNFVVDTSTLISPKKAAQEQPRPSILLNFEKSLIAVLEPAVDAQVHNSSAFSSQTKTDDSDNVISSTTDEAFSVSAYDILTEPQSKKRKVSTKDDKKTTKSIKKKKTASDKVEKPKQAKSKRLKSSSLVKSSKSSKSSSSVKDSKSKKKREKSDSPHKKKKVSKDKSKKRLTELIKEEDIEEGEIFAKERRLSSKKKSVHGDHERSSPYGKSSSPEPARTRSRSTTSGSGRDKSRERDEYGLGRRNSPPERAYRHLSFEDRFSENSRSGNARSNRGFSPEVRRTDYREVSPQLSLCPQPARSYSPDLDGRSSFDRRRSPDRRWPSSRSDDGNGGGRRSAAGRNRSLDRRSPDFERENFPRRRSSADWNREVSPDQRRPFTSNRSNSPTRSRHSRERGSPEWNRVVHETVRNGRRSSPAPSSVVNDEVFKIPDIPKAKKSKTAHGELVEKPENVVEDILDLIEKHLTQEDGQIISEIFEPSDTEDDDDEVGSISNMSVFGKKPLIQKKSEKIEINLKYHEKKKQKERAKSERQSSVDNKKRSTRSSSRKPERAVKPRRIRQRSLSPVGTIRPRKSIERVLSRSRRSISPSISIASRRRNLSPDTRRRAHRASSYDTIASSMIDKKALREIAIKNSIEFRRLGKIPSQYTMTAEERAVWRSGGKSLDDLTAFCKRMAQKERAKNGHADDDRSSVASELPVVNHPYHVKDRPLAFEIPIDIRGCRTLSLRTTSDRNLQNTPLRQLFPVSTGSAHRDLTWQRVEDDTAEMRPRELKAREKESSKDKRSRDVEEGPENEPMTLEKQLRTALPAPDYRIPVSFSDKLRLLKFQRQLACDPHNPEILTQMQDTQQQMLEWANQFQYRGDGGFTGEVVVAKAPLHGPGEKQAWARRDQLMNLAPVGGKGQYLLQKMGWVHGQAIGLRQTGQLEPLKMEVKMNKRGLVAEEEKRGAQQIFHPLVKTVEFGGCAAVHPCSALNEACTKRGWGTPRFEQIDEAGTCHRKNFVFKVTINNVTYKPTVTGSSKKLAKAEVAKWCLEALGIIDKSKEKEAPKA